MDAEEVLLEDYTHTGCYIFKPTTDPEEEEIDHRPQKRRKLTNKSAPQEKAVQDEYTWPGLLGGRESPAAIRSRMARFESLWARQQTRLDEIVNKVDEGFVQEVLTYARSKDQETLRAQGKLQTGLLVSSPGRSAQSDFHQSWEREMQNDPDAHSEILVQLRPSHSSNLQIALKNAIRLSMDRRGDYAAFLAEHKALIPMNYDLELLQRYTEKHSISRVLVSIVDVEGFDSSVLSELISTFHSWSDRIPIVLFIGITTTIELFESRLSRSTVSRLDAQVYEPSHPMKKDDPLYDLYRQLQHADDTEVFLGPALVNVLAELAQDQSATMDTFIYAVKYAYMSHFFANPLSSITCQSDIESPRDAAMCQAIRNTAGFKIHCEALAKGDKTQKQSARLLLTSDEALQTESMQAIESGVENMRSSLTAISTLQKIYHNLLSLDDLTPLECETHLLASLPDVTESGVYETIETAILRIPSAVAFQGIISDALSALPDLREYGAQGGDKVNTLDHIADQSDVAGIAAAHSSTSPLPQAESFLGLLREYVHARTSDSLSLQPTNPFRAFMAESYSITNKSPLVSTLHPRARTALERALTRPADYLGCACCATPAASLRTGRGDVRDRASLPPSSLLLSMLNEAGTVINVRDLWDAFRDTLAAASDPMGNRDGHIDEDAEDVESTTDRQLLAVFYRALADLRHLGLVRQSKRKPGVECISKTAWMGL